MFGQILDKLDAWIGRSFLLASFFPFLIFVAANLAMVQIFTPNVAKHLASFFSGTVYGSISATAVGLAAIAALAYLTDPLVGVMTKLLEGTYFPRSLAGLLASDYATYLRDLRAREQSSGTRATGILARKEPLLAELRTEQQMGDAIGAMRKPGLIQTAAREIRPLQQMRDRQQPIELAQLEAAARPLKAALKKNCMDKARLAAGEDAAASAELNSLFQSMVELIDYARVKALDDRDRVIEEKQRSFAPDEVPPTRFGNSVAALRGFCQETFHLDFDFLWPMVQIAAQADQKTADALGNAKQKLDFCIRILMFTGVFTGLWLIIAAFTAQSVYAVPVIGTLGLLVAALWLEIVHQNYNSFAELVRSVIMLKRFDVLKMLHYAAPSTSEEEMTMWEQISDQLKWRSKTAISYHHPDK